MAKLGIALLISFLIIFYGTKWQLKVTSKFPPSTQCDKIKEKYGDTLETFAINDFKFNAQREAEGKQVKYAGQLQCFCLE